MPLFIRHLHRKAERLSLRISLSESINPNDIVSKLTLTVDVFVKLKSQYEVGQKVALSEGIFKKEQKKSNTRFLHKEWLHALVCQKLQPLKWNMSNIMWINRALDYGMALSEPFSVQVEFSCKVRL